MEQSLAEQERDLKDIIRRAKGNPDKKGSLRREALTKLIGLITSPHATLKILAAGNIRHFFVDFPDLEEASINAIYDLCEDQSPKVRIEGYTAISQASKAEKKWIKRNADVLLQLLQSDEPNEVLVVKKALIEHLDMDSKITLGVLCDQIIPPDDAMEEEETNVRDRLRSLVLSFLNGEAKRAIVERHALPGTDSEDLLIGSLLTAISKLGAQDAEIIVRDLLLSLAAYKTRSPRGQQLLETLLKMAASGLREDLQQKPSSIRTCRPYLDLAYTLVKKELASPADLLQFYCISLIGKLTLQQISSEYQVWVIHNTTLVLCLCENDSTTPNLSVLRRQIIDASPFLMEVLCKSTTPAEQLANTSITLLQACIRRKKESSWVTPKNLLNVLQSVSAKMEVSRNEKTLEVQGLIRLLDPSTMIPQDLESEISPPPPPPPPQVETRINHPSSLPNRPPERSHASHMDKDSISFSAVSGKRPSGGDTSSQPTKRRKNFEAGDSVIKPSLLSRLQGTSIPDPIVPTSTSRRQLTEKATTRDGPPAGGWTIKGAAHVEHSAPVPNHRKETLLDRLEGSRSSEDRDRAFANRGRHPKRS